MLNVSDYSDFELQTAIAMLETSECQSYLETERETEKAYDKTYALSGKRIDLCDSSDLSYSERSALIDEIIQAEHDLYIAIGASSVYQRLLRDKIWDLCIALNKRNPNEHVSATKVVNIMNGLFDSFGVHTL